MNDLSKILDKAKELEAKSQHLEKFSPILVETLCRITGAGVARRKRAEAGLQKILDRDHLSTAKELASAEEKLSEHLAKHREKIEGFFAEEEKNRLDHGVEKALEADEKEIGLKSKSVLEETQQKATKQKVVKKKVRRRTIIIH